MMDGFVDYVPINSEARVSWDARNLPLKRLINVFAFLICISAERVLLIRAIIRSTHTPE